jgi:hypothetical protein
MYARVTPYKMKPGSAAAATKVLNSLKDRIMALPGQATFLNVLNDEHGTGYVVSTTDLAEMPADSVEKIKALWASFEGFLVEPPVSGSYAVIADWKA